MTFQSWIYFNSGFAVASFCAASVLFLKLWKVSADRFYLFFSISCFLIALERVLLTSCYQPMSGQFTQTESSSWIYLMRLAAFLVIVAVIVEKNQNRSSLK